MDAISPGHRGKGVMEVKVGEREEGQGERQERARGTQDSQARVLLGWSRKVACRLKREGSQAGVEDEQGLKVGRLRQFCD